MAHPHSHLNNSEGHGSINRSLRVATILALLPAVGLLLPYGIISARPLPTVGIAPLFFSAIFSTLVLGGRFQSPRARAWIDLLLAISIIALLIPSWIFLSRPHYSWKTDGRVVLGTYGTVPMILNCVLHLYLSLQVQALPSKIHISWEPTGCPNCHHDTFRVSGQRSAVGLSGGDKSIAQSVLPFYDDDARESSEFQTSGFNTPRVSSETLASSTRISGGLV